MKLLSSKLRQGMSLPKNKPLQQIRTLTIMRFFAAFMVFGFHFFNFPKNFVVLNGAFHRGFLGVDFFFLLSGFVLAYSYYDNITNGQVKFSKKIFFTRRLARILPVYYLALLLAIPSFLYELKKIPHTEKLFSLTTIPLSLTFLQSYSGLAITQNLWNVPAWSLSVELFFYMIFPYISLRVIKSANVKKYLLVLILLNILTNFIATKIPSSVNLFGLVFHTAWRNFPLYHLPQFLIGNCLALVYLKYDKLTMKSSGIGFLIFAILSSIMFTTFCFNQEIFSGNTYVVIAFSGLILYSAFLDKYITLFLPDVFVLLGEASYSLYILQSPLKLLLQQVWSNVLKISYVDGFLFALYLSTGAIISSILTYKYFEVWARKKVISIFLSTSDK